MVPGAMWLARPKPDPELLSLFEESARNVAADRAAPARPARRLSRASEPRARDPALRARRGPDRARHPPPARPRTASGGERRSTRRTSTRSPAALDDIVDYAEEAADQLGALRRRGADGAGTALAGVLVDAAEQVAGALRGLRGGTDLRPHLVEIHRLENEGDRLIREAVASLFANGIDPMVVIRWKDIFDSLEDAVDACETVAHVLEGISIKRARR